MNGALSKDLVLNKQRPEEVHHCVKKCVGNSPTVEEQNFSKQNLGISSSTAHDLQALRQHCIKNHDFMKDTILHGLRNTLKNHCQ